LSQCQIATYTFKTETRHSRLASSLAPEPFDELAKSILTQFLRRDPALATQAGCHSYDHLLRDPSRKAMDDEVEELHNLASRLNRFDATSLSGDQRIDLDYAIHMSRLRVFELTKLRKYEKGSFGATELGNSLFFLFSRERPSIEERLQSIIARIDAAPEFLEESMGVVTDPYRLWNEILLETGRRMPRFLTELQTHFESKGAQKDSLKELEKAISKATDALEKNNTWMEKEVLPNSSDSISIGPDLYREYLKIQRYGVSPFETLSIAEKCLEEVNRRKSEVARGIVGSADASLAIRRMRSDHAPEFDDIMEEYRASILKARGFIQEKDLVTVPDKEKLLVTPTPSFMEHVVPYAAQYEPGKFDGDMTGQFLVTSTQGNPEILQEHNHVAIVNTSVHEGYPGHHLHGICSNLNPSLLRVLHASPDFAEGWGLYCEEMMISQGYNDTPMGRLTILNDLGFRIARQICDVKISTGQMNLEQAADLLIRETGTAPRAAISEAKAMTLSPTYYMSYFVGKLGVLQMREDAEGVLGARFSLKFFHDSLIYSGCMPMPFMREALSLRIRERYGRTLGPQKESLYQYAMRGLARGI
jgi:uncharacterized protein (DUF885 family)